MADKCRLVCSANSRLTAYRIRVFTARAAERAVSLEERVFTGVSFYQPGVFIGLKDRTRQTLA
jgi:hypothetical protein